MMFSTLRRRIGIPYIALILVTMLALGVYLVITLREYDQNNLNAQLSAQARLVSESLAQALQSSPKPEFVDPLAKHWAGILGTRITIISPDGTVLGDSHQDYAIMENHLDRPEISQALTLGQGSSTRFSTTLGFDTVYSAVIVNVNGSPAAIVRLSVPLQEAQSNLTGLLRFLIMITLATSLIGTFLALRIADQTVRPLHLLTEAVTRLASSDLSDEQLSQRLAPSSPEEIGRLTLAFNRMATRLQTQVSALEAERKKVAAVLQEMTDGVIIVDERGRLQMINPSAAAMFEIDGSQALGRSLLETLRNHNVLELWQSCRQTGEPQSTLLEISTTRLYLHAIASPLDQVLPGDSLLLFQNLTRQRYLETVRRDFISNISHELRTPLASLKALTETLQEGALDDPPAARRFLHRMETEVDALTQMVAELLELSRIESGRVPMQFRPTAPLDVILPAVERLRLQAQRARLELSIDCANDLPLVLADSQRLEQVVVNLLHNAIKFTQPGGHIDVRATLKRKENGIQEVHFSVSDTGEGIVPEDLPRIFERFYKADRARAGGGTGLGLAIARHTVEAHHGVIWAESELGKGSTFVFAIPLAL